MFPTVIPARNCLTLVLKISSELEAFLDEVGEIVTSLEED
jgi:hypothetical protein